MTYIVRTSGLERHTPAEILRVEPWGPHAARVRASSRIIDPAAPRCARQSPPCPTAEMSVSDDGRALLVDGRIALDATADGRLRFRHAVGADELKVEIVMIFHAALEGGPPLLDDENARLADEAKPDAAVERTTAQGTMA